MSAATLVAVSHGTSDPRGQGAIRRLVDGVRGRLPDLDVRQAFVDVEAPGLASALADVDGPATVVPLLLGAGFHVRVDIATAVQARPGTITAPTLGPDRLITSLLLDRLRDVGLESDDAIVLAVAGSSDVRARLAADRAAAMLATSLRRRVRVGHLGGAGRATGARQQRTRCRRQLPAGSRVLRLAAGRKLGRRGHGTAVQRRAAR